MLAKIVAGLLVSAGLGTAGVVWATSGSEATKGCCAPAAASCPLGCCPGPCCDDPAVCPNGCCPCACCGADRATAAADCCPTGGCCPGACCGDSK